MSTGRRKASLGKTLVVFQVALSLVLLVGDSKYDSIRSDVDATLYLPYLQTADAGSMTFELKTAASTPGIASEIREAVHSIDKDLALLEVRTQMQQSM